MAAKPDAQKLTLLALIDAEYTRHSFYGSRKIKIYLRGLGHKINRKWVQRLMGMMGLAGMAPGLNTSRPHPQHKVYPYLLRGVNVIRPNQVWSTDITYIHLARGFVYLVAVIDKGHGIAISMDGRGRALDIIFVERLWRSQTRRRVFEWLCHDV
ncbi:MAG: HTH-like domain-containing protein [Candidatus Nitrotoga sp. LAW]|nr:MAG: HTH-like domain-containing protein [Candidatus Nitrotoga sp. LAW]